jgi:aldose 1-epimerase
MKATEILVGRSADGQKVKRFVLESARGVSVQAVGYGASIVSVTVPDAKGRTANVVLSYGDPALYEANPAYFGCMVGRFGNRIRGGRFTLDGTEHSLACNDGANHLHGGIQGFQRKVWAGKLIRAAEAVGIRWSCVSPAGEEGYPGTLRVRAEYVLTERGELVLEYWAATDAATPVNLTNHAYFNLAGAGSGTVLGHEACFNAPFYLPVDDSLIPTGEVIRTAGTPFDFSSSKPIGRDIGSVPGGYDHCYVVGKTFSSLGLAATVRDPVSGRSLQVWTTKPGVQFYTGNFLDGTYFPRHGGFCLETQLFPDSVNVGHFPSCILRPGETYHHKTVYAFSA